MTVFYRIVRGWKARGGFTILELLAVFAILAIIAALVVPKYSTVVAGSKIKACESNIVMLTKAAEMYKEVKGSWPTDEQALKTEGFINEYVYCPVASTKSADTDYEITNGVVTCDNATKHNEP